MLAWGKLWKAEGGLDRRPRLQRLQRLHFDLDGRGVALSSREFSAEGDKQPKPNRTLNFEMATDITPCGRRARVQICIAGGSSWSGPSEVGVGG